MRTLLVGLDAACFPVLEPLFEADAIPTLERLFSEGATGSLESQIPPWTASAWPSLYTGMNPGRHGVFDFLSFDGYDWDIVNATDVRQRTIWEYLDYHGLSSVVVNAPVTYPVRPFDGALLPGYLAPENPSGHPAGILQEVRDAVGEYRVYSHRETDGRQDSDAKYRDYLELVRLRGEAFRYLSKRFDPDFGFVQFQKTDAVFHDFPGDDERVRGVYERVDKQVTEILDACDPDTVVVASDHGIGPYDGYEVRVNRHLQEAGFVSSVRGGQAIPSWFKIKDERLTGDGRTTDTSRLEELAKTAAAFGLTYQRAKRVLDRLGLAEFVGRHVPISAVFAASEAVEFSASVAYLRSPSELGVRLNLEGREPDGVVSPTEYESIRDSVIETLRAVRTPDGDAAFDRVVPREAVFEGPYTDDAVDIVAVPSAFDNSLSALLGEPFGPPEPWNHKLHGVVSLSGAGVDPDADLSGAHLFDVAPTVLATLDLPPDHRMDGEILPVVESVQPTTYPDFEPIGRAATDDESVASRLSDLGYLE